MHPDVRVAGGHRVDAGADPFLLSAVPAARGPAGATAAGWAAVLAAPTLCLTGTLTATASVYAEVDPLQKARIVTALRAAGRTVGYLADGLNDTAALRAADVGISFAHATPLARHAADAILLDAHLTRLAPAIRAARQATLNATKYLKATLAANLSNLSNLLAAALLLPFAPMLPTQILAQNLLYDLAQLTLPTDLVAPDQTSRPHRWSTRDLARFMCCFAPLSTVFDLATFWALWHLFAAHTNDQTLFSTGWFLESLLTQAIAVRLLRTPRLPRRKHRPARSLTLATLTACALALPYSPLAPALTHDTTAHSLLPVPRRHHPRLPDRAARGQDRVPPPHPPLALARTRHQLDHISWLAVDRHVRGLNRPSDVILYRTAQPATPRSVKTSRECQVNGVTG